MHNLECWEISNHRDGGGASCKTRLSGRLIPLFRADSSHHRPQPTYCSFAECDTSRLRLAHTPAEIKNRPSTHNVERGTGGKRRALETPPCPPTTPTKDNPASLTCDYMRPCHRLPGRFPRLSELGVKIRRVTSDAACSTLIENKEDLKVRKTLAANTAVWLRSTIHSHFPHHGTVLDWE